MPLGGEVLWCRWWCCVGGAGVDDGSLGVHGRGGLSVGAAIDVLDALVAVVAQGPIVVVGEEPDQLVGAVLGRSEQPQGRAPSLALPKCRCLASRSETTAAIVLARMERCCWRREVMLRTSSAS